MITNSCAFHFLLSCIFLLFVSTISFSCRLSICHLCYGVSCTSLVVPLFNVLVILLVSCFLGICQNVQLLYLSF